MTLNSAMNEERMGKMKNQNIVDAYEEIKMSDDQKERMVRRILNESTQEIKNKRGMKFKRWVLVASCMLAILVTTGGVYAAYEYGYLDQVFGLNRDNKYGTMVDDYSNLTAYMSEVADPVVVGDYEVQILSHLISRDTQMGLVYYSIENVNEASNSVFAILNADDNGTNQYKNYYFGNGRSYTEEDMVGKNRIQLKIPQADPPFDYLISRSEETDKLYVVLRYVSVDEPFTFLNLVETSETSDGAQDNVIGTVSLPQAQSLPTKTFTAKNDENSDCRIVLSQVGMVILNVNEEDQDEILENTIVISGDETMRVSDVNASMISWTGGGSNINIQFRLLLKINQVDTITLFGQEYILAQTE